MSTSAWDNRKLFGCYNYSFGEKYEDLSADFVQKNIFTDGCYASNFNFSFIVGCHMSYNYSFGEIYKDL